MTEAVAIYGAIIGTIAAIATAITMYKNRPIVRLEVSQFMPTNLFPHRALAITAINHGWRTVTLGGGGLEFEDGWTLVLPLERLSIFFPFELKEGKSHSIWFTVDELRDALDKNQAQHGTLKYGFFTTSTGQKLRKRLNTESSIWKEATPQVEVRETG